jgi:DNA-binding MarR family transcriptional regulator
MHAATPARVVRFDEVFGLGEALVMSQINDQAAAVLRHYPRIYIACHTDHRDRKGQGGAITARDQTILAHIPDHGIRPNALAAHLYIAASTLSAALKRLASLRLVTLETNPEDARGKIVRLAPAGQAALSRTSVLDVARVMAALRGLNAEERAAVVRGLSLLADAAQTIKVGKS